MPTRVAVIRCYRQPRSESVCQAMVAGIARVGDTPVLYDETSYRRPVEDCAVFYGLKGNLAAALKQYPAEGKKAVYVDMGYWGRRAGGQWVGYHKLAVNDRHPTEYFRNAAHPTDRLSAQGVVMAPYAADGKHILLAGLGEKAAHSLGLEPEGWERDAIEQIRAVTDRRIIYRPKPSWKGARPIAGVDFSPPSQDIAEVLAGCHAVVTRHSNVALEGLVAGVPCFASHGVAAPMGLQDLARIEAPHRPDDREQWAADVAYTQWNVAEMRSGAAWRHLKDEGLVP